MLSVFSGEVRGVRFGYLDRDSNFTLIYDRGENEHSIYPGIYYVHDVIHMPSSHVSMAISEGNYSLLYAIKLHKNAMILNIIRVGWTEMYISLAEGFPPDGTPLNITHTYHVPLVTVYYVVAMSGVILTGITFVINFVYRNKK